MDQALIRRGGQETAEDNQTKISNKMKKVIAINGSPRKNWNTAIMLQSALESIGMFPPFGTDCGKNTCLD